MNKTKLLDFFSRKNSWEYYSVYKKTQWYSEKEMLEFRLKKLKKLLQHCKDNVPFYSKIIHDNNIDINNVHDFSVLNYFPIVDKDYIKLHYEDFIPKNIKKLKGVKISQTSGTTGGLLIKRTDAPTRSSTFGSYRRFLDWMGIEDKDYLLSILGGHVSKKTWGSIIKERTVELIHKNKFFSPYKMNSRNIEALIKYVNKNKPTLIRGYSQAIYELCLELKKRNITFNFKAIYTTSEPLLEYQRKLFRVILNSEAFDQYGCGEIGGIAYECDQHRGLHITEERVYIEVSNSNELIITDLDNFAMPYIRYSNGDEIILTDEKCTCGRKSSLIKSIHGRTCDYIVGINGLKIHWGYFLHLIFDSGVGITKNIVKFQVHQTSKEEIIIKIVSQPLNQDDKDKIIKPMITSLGEMNIQVINVDDIPPVKSGKYRLVISDIL